MSKKRGGQPAPAKKEGAPEGLPLEDAEQQAPGEGAGDLAPVKKEAPPAPVDREAEEPTADPWTLERCCGLSALSLSRACEAAGARRDGRGAWKVTAEVVAGLGYSKAFARNAIRDALRAEGLPEGARVARVVQVFASSPTTVRCRWVGDEDGVAFPARTRRRIARAGGEVALVPNGIGGWEVFRG